MLSTEDERQTPAWSERQAGKRSSMASIVESDFDDSESLVEKSGTGIRAAERTDSRRPQSELLAFAALCRFGLDWQNVQSPKLYQDYQPAVRKPTWH